MLYWFISSLCLQYSICAGMSFTFLKKKKKDTAQNQINPHRSDKVIRLGECSVMLFKGLSSFRNICKCGSKNCYLCKSTVGQGSVKSYRKWIWRNSIIQRQHPPKNLFLTETEVCYHLNLMLWFNPIQQLSTTQLLTHSSPPSLVR